MSTFKNIKYNCKEAQILGIKKQHKSLSLADNVKLMIHLFYCKYCKRFLAQSKIIDKAMEACTKELEGRNANQLTENKAIEIQELINKHSS